MKMNILIGDIMQIIIAIVMAIATFISYLSIKKTIEHNTTSFFSKICEQDRNLSEKVAIYGMKIREEKDKIKKLKLKEIADKILFAFYEYVAILFFDKKITIDLFFNYFLNSFSEVYDKFMDSPLFENYEDKSSSYENLCRLFNQFGLSIKNKTI